MKVRGVGKVKVIIRELSKVYWFASLVMTCGNVFFPGCFRVKVKVITMMVESESDNKRTIKSVLVL